VHASWVYAKKSKMNGKWYYQVMGETLGPVDGNEFHTLVEQNEITRDSFVRRENADWVTADRIVGLFGKPLALSRNAVETEMYYQVIGEIRGPFTALGLQRLAARNDINRDTFVRRNDEDWVTADQVPGLLD
jgi:hypothetical protein